MSERSTESELAVLEQLWQSAPMTAAQVGSGYSGKTQLDDGHRQTAVGAFGGKRGAGNRTRRVPLFIPPAARHQNSQ